MLLRVLIISVSAVAMFSEVDLSRSLYSSDWVTLARELVMAVRLLLRAAAEEMRLGEERYLL